MDKLWAPWRGKYITQVTQRKKECVFCKILGENKDRENYILSRTKYNYAVLNLYPYNNGHMLIVPHRHVKDLDKLERQEREDLFDLLQVTKKILDNVLKPEGYNIGINLGRVAGAGFPGHLHVHLVPRWKGDMNFMPVTASTKVISQSLIALYNQLKNADKKRYRRT